MSRIGRKPISIPAGVEVKIADRLVSVKGPLGKLDWSLAHGVGVTVDKGQVLVSRSNDDRKIRALHGLVRAELRNMIAGVTTGYERALEITGVGYKAQVQGQVMTFNVGYVNPVTFH
ncbi:MAG: 50S ribosomal protein L6, partial [Nitrospiraceae bacterium]